MPRFLAINGSYRDDGAIDQAVEAAARAVEARGATVEIVRLRDYPIEFCLNCRHCTQQPGDAPGDCVLDDRMHELIGKIEAADGLILASPTNFYAVTALFKRFMERLIPYAYWPWGMHAPKFRKKAPLKKAILIASSAAPGPMGRLFYSTLRQLRMTAKTVGAKPVASVFIGLMSDREHPVVPDRMRRRLQAMADKLFD